MKKQFFLLSLMLTAFNASMVVADCATKCDTSCATSCAKEDTCSTSNCVPEHGHTFMSIAPEFGAASPERVSLFESNKLKNLKHNEKHGGLNVVLFGGRNTKGTAAAGYYLPYGHTKLTFDGSIKANTFSRVLAESVVQINSATQPALNAQLTVNPTVGVVTTSANIQVDPASYKFDVNKDTSKILPWNFGITYAALFEPNGIVGTAAGTSTLDNQIGAGLIKAPAFTSTINPCLRRWHIGAGMELAYHFSDEVDGWYGKVSTAVQHVRSKINLNEVPGTDKDKLDNATLTAASDINGSLTAIPVLVAASIGTNPSVYSMITAANTPAVSTTAPVAHLKEAYINSGFPTDEATETTHIAAPADVAAAFNQSSWKYGKIGCEQKITRLADIELSVGRIWTCGDCASTSWEIGAVIPTGNKACADFVAPAVVGNGQHFGIRMGSTTSIMLSEKDDSSTWFRMDTDSRYLFRNTQKRSFDLKGNEWSRYMMVWANKEAYTAAVAAANAPITITNNLVTVSGLAQRGYTPGINSFTTDFYVKPQFQGRLNSAVVMAGERFQAELGWNVHARTKECVELACAWDSKPAFADSSYLGGVGLNNNRTIYNDSQTTVVNAVTNLSRAVAAPDLITLSTNLLADAAYDDFAITDAEINLDSVATSASISHTPYLTLGYSFDYDWAPVVAVGASYEFTASNSSINQWLVYGKFECAF